MFLYIFISYPQIKCGALPLISRTIFQNGSTYPGSNWSIGIAVRYAVALLPKIYLYHLRQVSIKRMNHNKCLPAIVTLTQYCLIAFRMSPALTYTAFHF